MKHFQFPVSLIISLVTLLVYTGVSFRLAFAKRMRKYVTKKRYDPEANGWLSGWFPYVSNLAWSTLDLVNLYVSWYQFPIQVRSSMIYVYFRFVWPSLSGIQFYGTSKPKNWHLMKSKILHKVNYISYCINTFWLS